MTGREPWNRGWSPMLWTPTRLRPPSHVALAEALGVHRNNGSLCTALAQLRKMCLLPARGAIVPTAAYYGDGGDA